MRASFQIGAVAAFALGLGLVATTAGAADFIMKNANATESGALSLPTGSFDSNDAGAAQQQATAHTNALDSVGGRALLDGRTNAADLVSRSGLTAAALSASASAPAAMARPEGARPKLNGLAIVRQARNAGAEPGSIPDYLRSNAASSSATGAFTRQPD